MRQEPSMSLINMAKREINCKIVYYGIGLSGKTTNLHFIHKTINPRDIGDMVSIDTETERTLYFDLLPLDLGRVHGFQVRFQLHRPRPGALPADTHLRPKGRRLRRLRSRLAGQQAPGEHRELPRALRAAPAHGSQPRRVSPRDAMEQ